MDPLVLPFNITRSKLLNQMQAAPSLPKKARICSPMAGISFKPNNNWTGNAVFRGSVVTAADKEKQQLDFDEAGTPWCVDSAGGQFLSLHPSDVPTWQEFVSKVCPQVLPDAIN